MYNPVATYRIQFHSGFTFNDFQQHLDYWQKLGVKTIYASPIFEAVPGSTHGYDALNPHRVNPEVGTLEQLKEIAQKLKVYGIGWLQDIVPNHMAFDTRNPWLADVLEKGRQSVYAPFFDVSWNDNITSGHIMAPFLGSSLKDVIKNVELKLEYSEPRLVLKYYESAYPLRLHSYEKILAHQQNPNEAIKQLLQQLSEIEQLENPKEYSERFNEVALQFSSLMKNETVRAYVQDCINAINADKKLLLEIADQQVYRLCHWQETDVRINFRRFFTINGLICLNIQDKNVFDHFHQFISQLVTEGLFNGLRIDHIDGLYDPAQYLQRVRELGGPECYTVVEKILALKEDLPSNWPTQGNSGYDFLAWVNNLFTNKEAEKPFTQFYYSLVSEQKSIQQQVREKKAYILYHHMGGELENLYQLFMQLVQPEQYREMRTEDIKTAIGEFLIHCPVYRYYGNNFPLPQTQATAIQAVFNAAKESRPDLTKPFDLLQQILFEPSSDEQRSSAILHFYMRLMQFSGPLMAKGVEDTLMYTFNRFIGHNEVGDSPEAFGVSTDEFHKKMKERQQQWPLSLNATSTHDTKRGEDARARLNVLTDLSAEWMHCVTEWQEQNAHLKKDDAPDPNDEYFIYQSLIASYPFEEEQDYGNRLQEYLQKALREAKLHSNWTSPNEQYETATKEFAVKLLVKNTPFWKAFQPLFNKVAEYGIYNSLAQVLLKFTCPGVPDIYQGCEGWDFSFVDPDNRRPVDYAKYQQSVDKLEEKQDDEHLLNKLWEERSNGLIKLWLTQKLLMLRTNTPDLFTYGDYIPLKVEGKYADYVFAFGRKHKQTMLVTVVPLHLAKLCAEQNKGYKELNWADTSLSFSKDISTDWTNVLSGEKGTQAGKLLIKDVFTKLPFAVMQLQVEDTERKAGLLLHITSLPSPFGIGDLGPEARNFADFLHSSRQRVWQLLPINPTEAGQGHSPYSSTSSRAGNTLLISPELLVKNGLLKQSILDNYNLPQDGKASFDDAARVKNKLLETAWQAFKEKADTAPQHEFQLFCEKEKEWLDDFTLYAFLKEQNGGKPWYEWSDEHKLRKQEALSDLHEKHKEQLNKIKWLQYIFSKQWHSLKAYCNSRNIELMGDLPFYVSYDSADVWANPELFNVDESGNRLGMAGVPPDAFSADGQLWGMPVYKWDVLKERNYDWWIERLRKNMELFDFIRLDHFRAFAAYWEVPAGETTAKNGEWKEGPGADFFTSVQEQLGSVPFIAEDLGDIDDAVLALRDGFNLPGMKVLQFAFGEDMATSPYIPHNHTSNFVAYTGTHDNNTTRGWYRTEASDDIKQRVHTYVGRALAEDEIPPLFCRMALGSVAKIAILPLQDLLGLDELGRMNVPASADNNWSWRLLPDQLTKEAEDTLRQWTIVYNRG